MKTMKRKRITAVYCCHVTSGYLVQVIAQVNLAVLQVLQHESFAAYGPWPAHNSVRCLGFPYLGLGAKPPKRKEVFLIGALTHRVRGEHPSVRRCKPGAFFTIIDCGRHDD